VNPNDAATVLGTSDTDVTDLTRTTEDSSSETSKDASEIEIDEHGNMVDLAAAEEEKAYTHKRVIQPLNSGPPVEKTDLSTVNLDDPALAPPTVPEPPSIPEVAAPDQQAPVDTSTPPPEPISLSDQQPHEQTLQELEVAVDSPHVANLPEAERKAMAEAGYVPEAPSTLPQFPLPETDQQSEQPAPPAVPPPFVPPYMQPASDGGTDELNLPSPQ
jgi:hypothetical protein